MSKVRKRWQLLRATKTWPHLEEGEEIWISPDGFCVGRYEAMKGAENDNASSAPLLQMEENSWDDSAILAIYNMALSSHQSKKFRGESELGGLSRKQKKKAFKAALAEAQQSGAPMAAEVHALVEPPRPTTWEDESSLETLNGPNRAFVECFMGVTTAAVTVGGCTGVDALVDTGRSGQPPEEVIEAWSEMCSAYATYETTADKYAVVLSRWENSKLPDDANKERQQPVLVSENVQAEALSAPVITNLRDLEKDLRS